ncbi:NDT80/PhoG-like protein [Reticulomyxa filosa]|uniref:NDT80/PhoG-like protein n=1 Tax=Reticulomyxa filosa TaxID=46433 RepID=X6MGV3_RETFI|nr:NDT80/PhoG-like protein [Reticulomyxa filosa]|eukprot:ETO12280.1 NDT80/PhoG-like protein [Reticulomyxa filosa]
MVKPKISPCFDSVRLVVHDLNVVSLSSDECNTSTTVAISASTKIRHVLQKYRRAFNIVLPPFLPLYGGNNNNNNNNNNNDNNSNSNNSGNVHVQELENIASLHSAQDSYSVQDMESSNAYKQHGDDEGGSAYANFKHYLEEVYEALHLEQLLLPTIDTDTQNPSESKEHAHSDNLDVPFESNDNVISVINCDSNENNNNNNNNNWNKESFGNEEQNAEQDARDELLPDSIPIVYDNIETNEKGQSVIPDSDDSVLPSSIPEQPQDEPMVVPDSCDEASPHEEQQHRKNTAVILIDEFSPPNEDEIRQIEYLMQTIEQNQGQNELDKDKQGQQPQPLAEPQEGASIIFIDEPPNATLPPLDRGTYEDQPIAEVEEKINNPLLADYVFDSNDLDKLTYCDYNTSLRKIGSDQARNEMFVGELTIGELLVLRKIVVQMHVGQKKDGDQPTNHKAFNVSQ